MAQLVMTEDIEGLEAALGKEWSLNQPFQFCKHCDGLAIQLALVETKHKVIDYLLAKKANLNVPKAPAIVSAVSAADPALIDKLVAAGADVRAVNNVGYDAMAQALAWEHFELIPHLETHGLRFDNGSGEALKIAVFKGNRDLVAYMLERGADPNQPKSLAQGGLGERPLHTATYSRDLEMVKLLVKHGADPGLPNEIGQRPYLYAWTVVETEEMAQWLRAREPAAAHDRNTMRKLAQDYRVPEELIERMETGPHELGMTDADGPAVTLLPLGDIHPFTGMGGKYLALSLSIYDGAAVSDIVWCAKRRRLIGVDIEHGETFKLGKWADFATSPFETLERLFNRK